MKKLLLLGACLVALASSPVMAQTGPNVVVVRVTDGLVASQMVIVRGPGKNKQIDLPLGTNTKGLVSFGEAIQQAIAKLYQEGYSLKSTFGGHQGSASTLVFVKEK
jgi:hypothetical protein